MVLSARDRLSTENRRAVVSRFVWCASAAFSALSFQRFEGGPAQNFAITVCSAVRAVLVIERRLPFGVERYQGIMPGLGGDCVGSGSAGSGYREEIGRGIPGDGDDGVVDRRVQDGEAARRLNSGRLSARCLDDVEQL